VSSAPFFIIISFINPGASSNGYIVNLIEKFLRGEIVFDGKLLEVHRDIVAMPDGHEEVREVIRHSGAAVIIPSLGDDKYVLVRQYRHALGRETLEFPAGRLDPGENPADCALRELTEETGYRAGKLEFLFNVHPAPGYTDELLWIYHASELTPGESRPDPDEIVFMVEMSLDELLHRFKNGEITDSKTLNALLYLKCFR